MCSEKILFMVALCLLLFGSCSLSRRISQLEAGRSSVSLALPAEEIEEDSSGADGDSVEKNEQSGLMNAVLDSVSGDMVAVDMIKASKVTARFRHAAERNGKVTLAFDVTVPPEMTGSAWQIRLFPVMDVMGDSLLLDPVFITGAAYREAQEKGYQRYRSFIRSIVTDTSDFLMLHSLDIFMKRYFPNTYAMKNDTSSVSDIDAESLFGLRQQEAVEHYTKHGLIKRNERRKQISERMLSKVLSPVKEKIRLDTVISVSSGEITYRYVQTLDCRPELKKINLSVSGGIYEYGKKLYSFPAPENLTFYISSLSSLADTAPRYVMKIVERNVYESKKAVIDFRQGVSEVDLSVGRNEEIVGGLILWTEKIISDKNFETDSVVVTASCSPEGSFAFNTALSESRAESVTRMLSERFPDLDTEIFRAACVPENWTSFKKHVAMDTVLSEKSKKIIGQLDTSHGADRAEEKILQLAEYEYIKDNIYPLLRNVKFDIHMHRKDMKQDTVHTAEIDTVYMEGLKALMNLDYREAVSLLGKYNDYNSALAYLSAGYDAKALAVLSALAASPKSDYLAALALSRLGHTEEAYPYFLSSIEAEPSMLHRGRLDPEMGKVLELYEKNSR